MKELRSLYRGALALVFLGNEDFGIVMAEAQSCGTPIIAAREGGALDIVEDGITGWLVDPDDHRAVIQAVDEARSDPLDRALIAKKARRFSVQRFRDEIDAVVRGPLFTSAATHSPVHSSVRWRTLARSIGSVVCLSTADMDAPLWTNKQHLMSRLAEETHVVYIESIGLRRPRLTRRDIERLGRRMGRRASPDADPRLTGLDLDVVAPRVIPLHGSRLVRRANRRLLRHQLRGAVSVAPRPRLLWTYAPVAVDEVDLGEYDTVVYHCVDDLATVPGINPGAIRDTEARMAEASDVVFASAPALAERLALSNANTHLTPNVADVAHFAAALTPGESPRDLSGIREPRALFAGALSDYKIDWPLLAETDGCFPVGALYSSAPRGTSPR